MPSVSVIIPVYNGTNYLREAVDSVFAQTYGDYELLVVDDGSTDGTWDLVQSYGDRVRGFRKSNGGVASALNVGLREMRGRWFAWLSHDDLWTPTKLAEQVVFLENGPRFKACYTDYVVIDTHGLMLREVNTPWYPRAQALRALFGQMYIGGSTILVDRRCFEESGPFSESSRMTQDLDMWVRLLRRFEIGRVPNKLVQERTHAAQDSSKLDRYESEKIAAFERIFEGFSPEELFPELSSSMSGPRLSAHAHVWFAETMWRNRGYDGLAYAHYRRAIDLDPSLTNPARLKRALLRARRRFAPLLRRLRRSTSRDGRADERR